MSDMDLIPIPGTGSFNFSAVQVEDLADVASEFTLVTIIVDTSGSVFHFASQLLDAVKQIVKACESSPRAENLLVRLVTFNNGITEVHGFKPLGTIDAESYAPFNCGGGTNLFDAVYTGVAASNILAKSLYDQEYDVNGAVYIITDGWDNGYSGSTPQMIKEQVKKAVMDEYIESLITVLIGINVQSAKPALEEFKKEAELTSYIDVQDGSPSKLAKLAQFVSKSISAQSQSLGTGGPSQVQSLTF